MTYSDLLWPIVTLCSLSTQQKLELQYAYVLCVGVFVLVNSPKLNYQWPPAVITFSYFVRLMHIIAQIFRNGAPKRICSHTTHAFHFSIVSRDFGWPDDPPTQWTPRNRRRSFWDKSKRSKFWKELDDLISLKNEKSSLKNEFKVAAWNKQRWNGSQVNFWDVKRRVF